MPKPASRLVAQAVVRREADFGGKLLEKAFAFALKGLVYAQLTRLWSKITRTARRGPLGYYRLVAIGPARPD